LSLLVSESANSKILQILLYLAALPDFHLPVMPRFFALFLAFAILCPACRQDAPPPSATATVVLEGETMGTYYRVTFVPVAGTGGLQAGIDSLLLALNQEVSTYIDSSVISRFNRSTGGIALDGSPAMLDNYRLAARVFGQSGGAFDPTVMPLVNYWGFGYTPKQPVAAADSLKVDSLLQYVGFEKTRLDTVGGELFLRKTAPGVELDFSACAKGYGVDRLAVFLEGKGIVHYLVDIGGEARAKGEKAPGQPWRIGINTPSESAGLTDIQVALPLNDRAIATSGNYRNFYEAGGQKYSHTINPETGFPERSNLLSASIFAPDCATADAYATTCMVLGLEAGFSLIKGMPGLEGYFIYGDADGSLRVKYTPGLEPLITQQIIE
jgi:FAD:protein FMN transferase